MRNIKFYNELEQRVALALTDAGIDFIHESENNASLLGLYLPLFDVYLEVSNGFQNRIPIQLGSRQNVIVVQGMESVRFLASMLSGNRF